MTLDQLSEQLKRIRQQRDELQRRMREIEAEVAMRLEAKRDSEKTGRKLDVVI